MPSLAHFMNPIPWSFLDDYQSFPSLFMYKIAQMTYEVAIIGSGLVGSAIAYDLKNLGVRTIILESESDLGAGASRSNSGVLHTGFDSKPNTLETQLIRKQAERWPDIFAKLKIPYKKTGAVLLAKNSDEATGLKTIQKDALANGVKTNILSRQEIQRLRA